MKIKSAVSLVLSTLFALLLSHCAPGVLYTRTQAAKHQASQSRYADRSVREFRKQIDEMIAAPCFQPANFGILIEDVLTREIIYSRNPYKLFMPASNMKIFTTAAATALLGPDYRYSTRLYMDGEIRNDTLQGNLIVRGSGDPTISGRYNGGNALEIFQNWAKTLEEKGVHYIDGAIIGDDNIFEDLAQGYSWSWDDASYYYAAEISGISFNDNCIDLYILSGKEVGEQPVIWTYPETEYVEILNHLETVPADSQRYFDFYRHPETNLIEIFGHIPVSADTVKAWPTIHNPTLFTITVFKETLEKSGISVKGVADIDDTPVQNYNYDLLKQVAEYQSVPLVQMIETLNKTSHNSYAEHLQKTLGYEFKNSGSWKSGIQVEKDWFSSLGIDPGDIFIRDGSGLSRHNLVTPYQVTRVLLAMRFDKNWEMFFDSLPIGGVDGTLKSRFKGSNAREHVYAKTGYVGHVRALSGFVQATNGREYVFSILVNHYPTPTSAINQLQDDIITLLYNLE